MIISECQDSCILVRKLHTIRTVENFNKGKNYQLNLQKNFLDGVRKVSDDVRKVSDGVILLGPPKVLEEYLGHLSNHYHTNVMHSS